MEYRNAIYVEKNVIDCEILHPKFGWIPYTLDSDDTDMTVDNDALFAAMEAAGDVAAYVAPREPEPEPYPDLTARRFEWLLAFTGLGDVWDALETQLKDSDRAAYADVKSQRRAVIYRFDETIRLVGVFRPIAKQVAPKVDLSDEAIKAAWTQAVKAGK